MLDQKPINGLRHDLDKYFDELQQFHSTKELVRSDLYHRLKPEIDRILNGIVGENMASVATTKTSGASIRATAWNIERGRRLDGVIETLRSHPVISASDIFLLTELDYGMARSGNRLVAHEIATALNLNYVFAPSYINLSKGAGLEREADGHNTHALHGNAVFSRYPIRDPHAFGLPNGKDKMAGREKRIGQQRSVIATVESPMGPIRVVSVHLDAHSARRMRRHQLETLTGFLDTLKPDLPVLMGGDWNTSTYNSSRAIYSILGFWRRVFMGVKYVMNNHYPYPERWFERPLFRMLERRGYTWRTLNQPGVCTLHYDVMSMAHNSNAAEWVPLWCFRIIEWSLKDHDGLCFFKLDWFAGRHVHAVPGSPQVIGGLRDEQGPLSDHDAIVVDFTVGR